MVLRSARRADAMANRPLDKSGRKTTKKTQCRNNGQEIYIAYEAFTELSELKMSIVELVSTQPMCSQLFFYNWKTQIYSPGKRANEDCIFNITVRDHFSLSSCYQLVG